MCESCGACVPSSQCCAPSGTRVYPMTGYGVAVIDRQATEARATRPPTAKVRLSDLAAHRTGGLCPDCHEPIECYRDPEGYWVECACDAGYTFRSTIAVLAY